MRRRSAGPASAAGGAIYARRHFGQVDAHVVAEQMEDMRKMFGEIIQTSTWMDAATKQYAYEKVPFTCAIISQLVLNLLKRASFCGQNDTRHMPQNALFTCIFA